MPRRSTHRSLFASAAVLCAAVLFTPTLALAGEQYVDNTGYAASGYDVVAYFDLDQAPVGQPQPRAVPGKAAFTAEHNGARWAFSSQENRDRFLAAPEKYVPAYDGHCAYGVAVGGKVPANPHLWRIVDGRLFLNINTNVVGRWEKNISSHISTAEEIWQSRLEAKDASSDPVPSFDAGEAPV